MVSTAGERHVNRERCSTKWKHTRSGRSEALPDAHRGWSGPSGVNNKQWTMKQNTWNPDTCRSGEDASKIDRQRGGRTLEQFKNL